MKPLLMLFLLLSTCVAWGQEDTLVPVYRFRHDELHFWTIDKKEIKKLTYKSGGYWFNEGIAFYAHQSQHKPDTLPTPPARPERFDSSITLRQSCCREEMRNGKIVLVCDEDFCPKCFERDLDSTLKRGRTEFWREFLDEWDDYVSLHHLREFKEGKKLPMDFEEFMERFTRHLRRRK